MKCPKCGYLGFETSDRCRNCGYDFSLAVGTEPSTELPLRPSEVPVGPLADFDLDDAGSRLVGATPNLNLDRIIGAPSGTSTDPSGSALPLFPPDAGDDAPVRVPRPARTPLAVRRTTPEVQRGRQPRVTPPQLDMSVDDPVAAAVESSVREQPLPVVETVRPMVAELRPAAASSRIIAAAIDLVLLAVIDVVVVYLTLALTGLSRESFGVLPLAPLLGFFAILDGGYLVAFIAASGQTVGKMAMGIRVMGDDGGRVDVSGAVLRAFGCGLSLLTAGLGYLPAFVSENGRALQDRIAGTRVVSAR